MIEKYQFGKIIINGISYDRDVIVAKNEVLPNWWRKSGHELHVEDIADVVAKYQPEKIIVGTGRFGMMKVLAETEKFLADKNIELEAYKTTTACEVFNAEVSEKNVLGAFHLTC